MIERVFDILRLLISSPSDDFVRSPLVRAQAAQALSLSLRTDLQDLVLEMQSYMTLYGRTLDLRVKSKYVGSNNRNKDHLPQLSLVCACMQFGAIGGDLGKLWVSVYFFCHSFLLI